MISRSCPCSRIPRLLALRRIRLAAVLWVPLEFRNLVRTSLSRCFWTQSRRAYRIWSVFRDLATGQTYGLETHRPWFSMELQIFHTVSAVVMILWFTWSVWAWTVHYPLPLWKVSVRERAWSRSGKRPWRRRVYRIGTLRPARRSSTCSRRPMRRRTLWWRGVLPTVRSTIRRPTMLRIFPSVHRRFPMKSCVRDRST